MAEKLIAHPLPVARPAQPRTMLEVVRQHAPEIHDSIVSPRKPELDALSHVLKKEIASRPGVCPDLGARIYSLPAASLATVLLNAYRPDEEVAIRMTGPEIIEFIARWKGDDASVPLPGSAGFVPSRPVCGEMRPGSLQSFEEFVKRWHAEPEPGCDADPEVASSEFSAVFAKVLEGVESLTAKNAGLLEGLAAGAGEFLSCFLAMQQETAAPYFKLGEGAIADRRNISGMQPDGAYADIGCGKYGVIGMHALE